MIINSGILQLNSVCDPQTVGKGTYLKFFIFPKFYLFMGEAIDLLVQNSMAQNNMNESSVSYITTMPLLNIKYNFFNYNTLLKRTAIQNIVQLTLKTNYSTHH